MYADAPPELERLPSGFRERIGWTAAAQAALCELQDALKSANAETNLVGTSTLEAYWSRHIIDSAQLLWFCPEARVWADIGSGAGFPGLVLGILLKETPGAHVHLIESMAKRCRFLRYVVERLDLPCTVHEARAESVTLKVQRVTARACAPLDRLLGFVEPLFARGAEGIFLKGEGVDAEIMAARRLWRFDAEVKTSMSDPRGRILVLGRLGRAGKS